MTTNKNWRDVAFSLFGYKIMSASNHAEIAAALERIWTLLEEYRDVQIVVREKVEDAEITVEANATEFAKLPLPPVSE